MYSLKTALRMTLFLILSLSLTSNSLNLWMGNRDVAAVLLPGSSVISNHRIISGLGNNIVVAQSASTVANFTCTSSLSKLTLTKQVQDPLGLDTRGTFTNLKFRIVLTINGVTNSVTLQDQQSKAFCLAPGDSYRVTEDKPLFLSSSFQFDTTFSNTCSSSSVVGNQLIDCTIINKLNSITGRGVNSTLTSLPFPLGNNNTQIPTDRQTFATITPQLAVTPATSIPNGGNPPFKQCKSNVQSVQNTQGDLVEAPSSATYVVEGDIPLQNVRHAMENFHTDRFTIQILSDLNPSSNKVELTFSAPLLAGDVIVQSNDGAKQKVIPFAVTNVRTECHFITLAKAVGPNSNSVIAQLGNIGAPTNNVRPPDTNKLLLGGQFVTRGDQATGAPGILNPPFATCDSVGSGNQGGSTATDDVAIYNIAVTSSHNNNLVEIFGHNLIMELTVDLIQQKADLAKLANTNNPFVKVNLIGDKNEYDGHIIPSTLENLNTDCKNIAKTDAPVFKPIVGESNP